MPVKKVVKEVKKVVKEKIVKPSELEIKRNALIDALRPKLLTKSQLKSGGREVRSRFSAEQGYLAIIDEINELGKQAGLPQIGYNDLRKE